MITRTGTTKYKPLILDTLQSLSDHLSKFTKGNAQRDSFVSLYKHLAFVSDHVASDELEKVLMGKLTFEMEYIHKKEYRGYSPNKDKDQSYFNMFFGTGSEMYTEIKKNIHSKENPLKSERRLMYLNVLYHFVSQHLTDNDFKKFNIQNKNFYWKTKQEFINDIIFIMNKVKDVVIDKVNLYVTASPLAEVFESNAKKASNDYIELNKKRWRIYQNNKHESLAKFVNLIEQTRYLAATTKQADDIYEGAVVYAIMSIKDEWKYMFLYPEGCRFINNGSELVKGYLKDVLNKTRVKEIDRDTRVTVLRKLVEHIHFLKEEHKEELDALCQELAFNDLETIYKDLDSKFLDQHTKQNTLSWTGTAVKYSIQSAITLFLGGTAGFAGAIAYLAGGSLITQQAIDHGYSWMVDKFGTALTEQGAKVANIAKEGLQKIFNHASLEDEDKEEIVEWIMTLLTLPNEVMKVEDQDRIRKALGIVKGDSLSEEAQVRDIVGAPYNEMQYSAFCGCN